MTKLVWCLATTQCLSKEGSQKNLESHKPRLHDVRIQRMERRTGTIAAASSFHLAQPKTWHYLHWILLIAFFEFFFNSFTVISLNIVEGGAPLMVSWMRFALWMSKILIWSLIGVTTQKKSRIHHRNTREKHFSYFLVFSDKTLG